MRVGGWVGWLVDNIFLLKNLHKSSNWPLNSNQFVNTDSENASDHFDVVNDKKLHILANSRFSRGCGFEEIKNPHHFR
jgi:hypothetical protein